MVAITRQQTFERETSPPNIKKIVRQIAVVLIGITAIGIAVPLAIASQQNGVMFVD